MAETEGGWEVGRGFALCLSLIRRSFREKATSTGVSSSNGKLLWLPKKRGFRVEGSGAGRVRHTTTRVAAAANQIRGREKKGERSDRPHA